MCLYLTLHRNEKVQEWEDFLVVTVTERLELVSTVTPSKQSLSWETRHVRAGSTIVKL